MKFLSYIRAQRSDTEAKKARERERREPSGCDYMLVPGMDCIWVVNTLHFSVVLVHIFLKKEREMYISRREGGKENEWKMKKNEALMSQTKKEWKKSIYIYKNTRGK